MSLSTPRQQFYRCMDKGIRLSTVSPIWHYLLTGYRYCFTANVSGLAQASFRRTRTARLPRRLEASLLCNLVFVCIVGLIKLHVARTEYALRNYAVLNLHCTGKHFSQDVRTIDRRGDISLPVKTDIQRQTRTDNESQGSSMISN
jgi:hypothetical protein